MVVGARSADLRPHAAPGADRPGRRARIDRSSRKPPRAITPATWPWPGRRPKSVPLVLGSATPSLESWHRAQQGEYQLVEMPRRVLDRPLPEVGTIDLRADVPAARQSHGAISRPLAPGHDGRPGGRRAGDPALESPRLLDAHPVPGLRRGGALSRLRHRPDASPHAADRLVPLLRLRGAGPGGLSGLRLRRHPLQRPGHADAGGRGAGPLPQRPLPAHGHRHDARPRQPRAGPGRLSLRQGAASCWARR